MINHLPKPKSVHLQWHITERCNFRCKHCYLNDDYIKNELSTEQLFGVFDGWLDFCDKLDIGYRKLSLTGGEPLIRKDFFQLLEKISKSKQFVNQLAVMSNGSTITDGVAEKFVKLSVDSVQISVDGAEEVNDQIRGAGNFKKAIRGAKILIKHNMPVSFSLTAHKENVNEIPKLARIAAQLGVSGLGVGRLVPLGRGEELKSIMLMPLEVKKLYYDIERLNKGLRSEGYRFRVGLHCSDSLWCTENPDYKHHGCSTPYDVFTVLPNGDFVPCRRLPIKVGNVLEESFFELHYSSNRLWQIRNQENINDLCKNCTYFNICRGAGKCLAYAYFGTPFAPDPGCWHLFKQLPEDKKFKDKDSEKVSLVSKYLDNLPSASDKINLDEINKERQVIEIKDLNSTELNSGLIAFNLRESDLNKQTGDKIIDFLTKLKQKNTNFKITRPLPPCIFGLGYSMVAKKFSIPTSCKDCFDLFKVKDGRIILCNGKKGPDLKYMNSREQIYEYFEGLDKQVQKKELERCKNCIYKLRRTCPICLTKE